MFLSSCGVSSQSKSESVKLQSGDTCEEYQHKQVGDNCALSIAQVKLAPPYGRGQLKELMMSSKAEMMNNNIEL